jgi:hypothetical protein
LIFWKGLAARVRINSHNLVPPPEFPCNSGIGER